MSPINRKTLAYAAFALAACFCLPQQAVAQRQMEQLGRGLIAVRKSDTEVYVGWRMLGSDPEDIAFNLYRQLGAAGTPKKINTAPITATTDYSDKPGSSAFNDTITYHVRPVIGGVEQTAQAGAPFTLPASAPRRQYFTLPLRQDTGPDGPYTVKFCWVGDLDGDGEYDFVVDRHSSKNSDTDETNDEDAEGSSAYGQFLEAYKRDGTFLWRLSLGPNSKDARGASVISVGASDSVTVFDLDGDGRAEVVVRTANGVTGASADGAPTFSVTAPDNSAQFVSIIDGLTGTEKARAPIETTWNRYGPLTFRLGIAWLDGVRPSVVFYGMNRDRDKNSPTYLDHFYVFTAWNFRDGQLVRLWQLEQDQRVLPGAESHSLRIADVDNDGRDEICEIGHVIDHDGTQLFRVPGVSHGDRYHITDIDPDHPGLETYVIQQNNSAMLATALYEAGTGRYLKKWYAGSVCDVGRGLAADLTPDSRGYEMFSTQRGVFSAKGDPLYDKEVWPSEGLWWDSDLAREFIGGISTYGKNPIIEKFNPATGNSDRVYVGGKNLYSVGGDYSNIAGSGGRPAFWGDILGDWREEIVLVKSDCTELRILTTTSPATNRLRTLMHNPQYRAQTTTKGYVQGSYVDYYLGYAMPPPAPPPMTPAALTWSGSASADWSAGGAQNWLRDAVTPGATPAPAAYADGQSVLFDLSGASQAPIVLAGNLAPQSVAVYSPHNYTFTGAGKITGAATLTKAGAGSLTLENTHDYFGKTTVWDGALVVNGALSNSPVEVWGGVWGGAAAEGKTGGRLEGSGTISQSVTINENGALSPGTASATGTLAFHAGLATVDRSVLILDTAGTPAGANDRVAVTGAVTLSDLTTIIVRNVASPGTPLSPGNYPLITCSGGTITADLSKISIQTPKGTPFIASIQDGALTLTVPTLRAPATVTWIGGANSDIWDIASSPNWTQGAAAEVFVPGDAIIFDDAGAAHPAVTLDGELSVAALTVTGTADYTLSGAGFISGAGGLNKSGAGTLTLATANTHTGATTITGGVLAVTAIGDAGEPGPLGASSSAAANLVLNGGTLRLDAPANTNRCLTLGVDGACIHVSNTTDYLQISGTLTGPGALHKTGPGLLTLASANTHEGGVVIEEGRLLLAGVIANSGGIGSGTVTLKGGALAMSDKRGSEHAAWPVHVPAGAAARLEADGRCVLDGALTGSGTLDYRTPYVRSDIAGDWSAFAGRLNIIAASGGGEFRLNNAAGLPAAMLHLAASASAYYIKSVPSSGVTVPLGALSGEPGSELSGGPTSGRTLRWQIGAKGGDTVFAGAIANGSGYAALEKVGPGALTLTGTSTYTRETTVIAGALIVDGALGATAVTVKSDATIGGAGALGGSLTLENGARWQLPSEPDSGLAITGAVTLSGTVTVVPPPFFENI
ncbi:hypothetical protein AW736_15070, partial [Termitidicoccus mucosus]